MRYKPCSDAQKYELKLIGKIKSQFFSVFVKYSVVLYKNSNHCTKYEAWYTQNGIGGGYTPIPAIHFIHFKVFGDRYGLELHTTGSISDGTAGRVRNFRTSTGTQQFQASVRQYDSTLFLMWCLFYFYRHIAPYIFFAIWIGCGALTFLIGKPGWHIGASGIIYGLAFFCSSAAFCANMYRLSPFHCW